MCNMETSGQCMHMMGIKLNLQMYCSALCEHICTYMTIYIERHQPEMLRLNMKGRQTAAGVSLVVFQTNRRLIITPTKNVQSIIAPVSAFYILAQTHLHFGTNTSTITVCILLKPGYIIQQTSKITCLHLVTTTVILACTDYSSYRYQAWVSLLITATNKCR